MKSQTKVAVPYDGEMFVGVSCDLLSARGIANYRREKLLEVLSTYCNANPSDRTGADHARVVALNQNAMARVLGTNISSSTTRMQLRRL
jgi:hypothetical protein